MIIEIRRYFSYPHQMRTVAILPCKYCRKNYGNTNYAWKAVVSDGIFKFAIVLFRTFHSSTIWYVFFVNILLMFVLVVRVVQYGQFIPHLKALDKQISNMLVLNQVYDVESRSAT